ncbi:MAG: uracil phosphoribosyltransferase [bacterium]
MKHILLSVLRNKNTNIAQYRNTSEKLGLILAQETSQFLEKKEKVVETPMAQTTGIELKNNTVLIPILRSGLVLLNPFLKYYETAKVGFVGMKRDEKTAIPHLYYKNLPKIFPADDIIILDPMIATGGSGSAALEILKEEGIKEEKIIFVSVIASEEGISNIKNKFPKIRLTTVETDKELNAQKFIVPGLGDFGDRYFDTI